MCDVTVGIPCETDMASCLAAVQNVLRQFGVEIEVVVTGKASQFVGIAFHDPRVRWVPRDRAPTRLEMLRLLAEESSAPFMLSLKPHKRLVPGALSTLVAKLRSAPKLGMVHCLHFATDEDGHTSRRAYHDVWERAHKLSGFKAAKLGDYLEWDFLLDGVKLYRKTALAGLGLLAPPAPISNDYGMVWTAMTKLEFELIAKPLCFCQGSLPVRDTQPIDLRDYWSRVVALLSLRKAAGAAGYFSQFKFGDIISKAIQHLWRRGRVGRFTKRGWSRLRNWFQISGFSRLFYQSVVWMFRGWPLPRFNHAEDSNGRTVRIAYYIWQYPVASQTFVQREVVSLVRTGAEILVISEIPATDDFIAGLKPELREFTVCTSGIDREQVERFKRRFLRRNPVRYLCLFLYVVGRRFHATKRFRFDKSVFAQAVTLAAFSEQHGITHIHSPWADNCAFVALIAARLLRLPYSVQARAHDIHRNNYKFGLLEKFQNAEFVVTNTRYNVKQIQGLLDEREHAKVKLIYNGLNLEQFEPARQPGQDRTTISLLCVARLIEQKGLLYLIKACRILLDAGLQVQCQIVGGPEDIFMEHYIELKRRRQSLRLEPFVYFTGPKPFSEVLRYYRSADIFVLPCVLVQDGSRDIIPNSVLEAMAMKLPVVATTVTGLPEMVDHGQNGLLVAPRDEAALAQAIQTLAGDATLREQFGEHGRRKVEARFDSGRNVREYNLLFRNLSSAQQPAAMIGNKSRRVQVSTQFQN